MTDQPSLKTSILLLIVLILFSACGTTAQSAKTAAPSLDLKIVRYSASVRVQATQPTPVSASCKPGEQMIGGGFFANDVFEFAAAIDASYPSSPTTWTATGSELASYFDLNVEVYCVSAAIPLGVQIVQSQGAAGGSASCPQGTKLLSGGFQNAQPGEASYPLANGWMSPGSERVYALCASQHLQSSAVVTSMFNAHSSSQSYQPGGGRVTCPAGQIATGGGFDSHGDLVLASNLDVPPHIGWSIEAGGDGAVMVYALCGVLE